MNINFYKYGFNYCWIVFISDISVNVVFINLFSKDSLCLRIDSKCYFI